MRLFEASPFWLAAIKTRECSDYDGIDGNTKRQSPADECSTGRARAASFDLAFGGVRDQLCDHTLLIYYELGHKAPSSLWQNTSW